MFLLTSVKGQNIGQVLYVVIVRPASLCLLCSMMHLLYCISEHLLVLHLLNTWLLQSNKFCLTRDFSVLVLANAAIHILTLPVLPLSNLVKSPIANSVHA